MSTNPAAPFIYGEDFANYGNVAASIHWNP
jgi:hypothetical protein